MDGLFVSGYLLDQTKDSFGCSFGNSMGDIRLKVRKTIPDLMGQFQVQGRRIKEPAATGLFGESQSEIVC